MQEYEEREKQEAIARRERGIEANKRIVEANEARLQKLAEAREREAKLQVRFYKHMHTGTSSEKGLLIGGGGEACTSRSFKS